MKCLKCGAELTNDTKFCSYCGAQIESQESSPDEILVDPPIHTDNACSQAAKEISTQNIKNTVKAEKTFGDQI